METWIRSLGSHDSEDKFRVAIKIAFVSLLVRLASILVIVILPLIGLIECFDCSARLRFPPSIEGLVRWDTIHFIGITRREQLARFHPPLAAAGLAEPHARLEQDWAFGRAITWIFRFASTLLTCPKLTIGSPSQVPPSAIVWASILASLASIGSSVILFLLTLELFGSIRFATLASLLHVFSPSPSTQVVPYTEPFYAFFSFAAIYGHVSLSRPALEHRNLKGLVGSRLKIFPRRLFIASLTAVATSFRSIGIFQSLVWAWDWLEELRSLPTTARRPKSGTKRFSIFLFFFISSLETLILGLITTGPFLHDQWLGYRQFCATELSLNPKSLRRPWCQNRIPSIYNFVQSHYWDVGFLRYWSWNQSPLFLLSSPLYLVSLAGIYDYYRFTFSSFRARGCSVDARVEASTHDCLSPPPPPPRSKAEVRGRQADERPFWNQRIEVYVHLQLLVTLLLLLNSHVQIILRQATTMPLVWWTLADRLGLQWNWWRHPNPHHSKESSVGFSSASPIFPRWSSWFLWISIWFPISLILWAGFYPPA